MYFMSTVCGRPQGEGGPAHVDRGSQKRDLFVDIINGWPLTILQGDSITKPNCLCHVYFILDHIIIKLSRYLDNSTRNDSNIV